MSNLRKAAKQARTALANARDYIYLLETGDVSWSEESQLQEIKAAIFSLKKALAEPEQDVFCDSHCTWRDHRPDCVRAETEHEHNCYGDGNVYRGVRSKDSSVTTYFVRGDLAEPVAWLDEEIKCAYTPEELDGGAADGLAPLYTAPTPRKPLTEDQIVDIWAAVSMGYDDEINIIELARALERAHGITGDSDE